MVCFTVFQQNKHREETRRQKAAKCIVFLLDISNQRDPRTSPHLPETSPTQGTQPSVSRD